MGRELPALCNVETQRLLWLAGITSVMIITFQYLELPLAISSLFSTVKIPVPTQNGNRTLAADSPLSNSRSFNDTMGTFNISTLGPTINEGLDKIAIPEKENLNGTLVEISKDPTANIVPNNEAIVGDNKYNSSDLLDVGKVSETPYSEIVVSRNNASSEAGDISPPILDKGGKKEDEPQNNSTITVGNINSPVNLVPDVKKSPEARNSGVVMISEMNELLRQSRASHRSMIPKWSSNVDEQLLYAKTQIENAPIIENDLVLYALLFRNISMFKRSYELMEQMLKVYVYREGKRPIMHAPRLRGIYASEGWFMKQLESNRDLVTSDPKSAHLFYLPFSSQILVETLYVKDSHSHDNLIQYLKDYLDFISARHPFWNRTSGADHFLVACHDWAPYETGRYMSNSIRALCNADIKEGFVFGKDVSLPETNVRNSRKPLKDINGKPASQRSVLAFFAGSMHGYVRPILLSYWGDDKDPDMKIFGKMPRSKGNRNYIQFMKTSKYCICAKGYEVNSPRVVEAISYGCVPVIISDNFIPPFFEILNWESFAVFVLEKDIPDLKKILSTIPERRYREMQMNVRRVQKHFLWHSKPEKYDIFHMIIHSVWYNRVLQI